MDQSAQLNNGKHLEPKRNDKMMRFVGKKIKKFSPDQRDTLETRLKLIKEFQDEGYTLQFHSPLKRNRNQRRYRSIENDSSVTKHTVEREATRFLLSESAYIDFDLQKLS
jgi:hypothetical protein